MEFWNINKWISALKNLQKKQKFGGLEKNFTFTSCIFVEFLMAYLAICQNSTLGSFRQWASIDQDYYTTLQVNFIDILHFNIGVWGKKSGVGVGRYTP